MSGHSKWNNIKARKGKADAAKGKTFTKIGREIAVAVKSGGADPKSNARLRDIMAKARAANIPNDNVIRSIKKASGELGNINYETLVYEGYGPFGTALIVETLTDNKNRTVGDVRHAFDKHGGNLGSSGSVGYMFDIRGVVVLEKKDASKDEDIMMMALEAGAEDFNADDEFYEITCDSSNLTQVREVFESDEYTIVKAEVMRIPNNKVELSEEQSVTFYKMLDMLEDSDDVQNVYHNAELPDADDEE